MFAFVKNEPEGATCWGLQLPSTFQCPAPETVVTVLLGILAAKPLLGSFDQAFQYIQEYTGFFTPGIVVIFLLGLFWKRANEAGALAAAIGSFALSIALKTLAPAVPFMDRMGMVFLLALALAVGVSLATRNAPEKVSTFLIVLFSGWRLSRTKPVISSIVISVLRMISPAEDTRLVRPD